MTPAQAPLDASLVRFDGPAAILRFSDGQELRIPASTLPGAKVGDRISLDPRIGEAGAAAREVLNQLLSER